MQSTSQSRRARWIGRLAQFSGSFDDNANAIASELRAEIQREDVGALLEHLRFCGAVPEHFSHDSSTEKLYSKYTDAVVSEALAALGLRSEIINTRGDAADIQARASNFSLVADAKAFRLSRTAKNQKDFKIQALDSWRGGLDYALLVCPIYQMPSRSSQIYQQAISRNVCVLSYTHLAVLVSLSRSKAAARSQRGLERVLSTISVLHPSKNASDYWIHINRAIVESLEQELELWSIEKAATMDALETIKQEALVFLRAERNRILGLSHDQALAELLQFAGLDSRISIVQQVGVGRLLEAVP